MSRTVLLQAMKQDPPADYKCRDKFLVQAVPITGDKEFVSVQEIVRWHPIVEMQRILALNTQEWQEWQ